MRAFELPSTTMAFALELAEETVFINAVEIVRGRISPTESWYRTFCWRFFDKGHPLAADHLKYLNSHLVRCGLQPIDFRETNPVDDYIRFKNYEDHAENRRAIRDHLLDVTEEERARIVADAEVQVAMLEPAHRTWEQLMTDRNLEERTTHEPPTPVFANKIIKCGTVDDNADHYRAMLADANTRVDEMTLLLAAIETLPKTPIRKRLAEVVVDHYL